MAHQAKKRFGQNFIRDTNLLKKIVDQADIQHKNVLEIGPGLGALTQFLVVEAKKYLAYEIDYSLKGEIQKFKQPHTEFIFKDFLADDMDKTLNTYFNNEEIHLVANLPYNITTPIIFKFLEYSNLKSATIMVQKEVGDRMVSDKNLKSYNAFSAILQYHTKVTKIMSVNKKMFYPAPKVDSMVVRLEKIERRLNQTLEPLFESIVKKSFAHKRKTLLNNLSTGFDVPKSEMIIFLNQMNLNENTRAEELDVDQFIELTKKWKSFN